MQCGHAKRERRRLGPVDQAVERRKDEAKQVEMLKDTEELRRARLPTQTP
jgi:hypothetical protein